MSFMTNFRVNLKKMPILLRYYFFIMQETFEFALILSLTTKGTPEFQSHNHLISTKTIKKINTSMKKMECFYFRIRRQYFVRIVDDR